LTHDGVASSDILAVLSAILAQKADNLWSHLYATDLCMRLGHTVDAITHLNSALTLSHDNPLKATIAYQCALLHYEEGNHELMHSTLEQAYGFNNDCPHINNALAYYWTTKGKDPIKALTFIQKSLQADSTNPHFLDTQALILYKEKKYHEAQQILEQLANNNNGTMLLHLAKVHYKLNNKEIADTFTQKASALVKNNQEKKALHKMQRLLTQL
jgi:tetratricopeptide (TPR) repeat protein